MNIQEVFDSLSKEPNITLLSTYHNIDAENKNILNFYSWYMKTKLIGSNNFEVTIFWLDNRYNIVIYNIKNNISIPASLNNIELGDIENTVVVKIQSIQSLDIKAIKEKILTWWLIKGLIQETNLEITEYLENYFIELIKESLRHSSDLVKLNNKHFKNKKEKDKIRKFKITQIEFSIINKEAKSIIELIKYHCNKIGVTNKLEEDILVLQGNFKVLQGLIIEGKIKEEVLYELLFAIDSLSSKILTNLRELN